MKISKMFKRIASICLAVTMVMGCTAISTAADTTTQYTATADVYVAKKDNIIKAMDAYLTDTAVPPTSAPSQNATVEVLSSGYNVTVTLNNEYFELKSIATDSKAIDSTNNITATGAKVASTTTTTSKSGERIQKITFYIPELGEIYKFDASEYVNVHPFTLLYVGNKSFPISVKVTDLKTVE